MLKADGAKAQPQSDSLDSLQNGADAALARENAALRELVDSKSEIITLQKQLLAKAANQVGQDQRGMDFSGGPPASSALGVSSAAHLSDGDNN